MDDTTRQDVTDLVKAEGFDAASFCDWLADAVRNCMESMALAATVGARTEDQKWLAELDDELGAIARRLKLGAMPQRAEVAVSLSDEISTPWNDLVDRLRADVKTAKFKVIQARRRLEKPLSNQGTLADRKGRPPVPARNRLLYEVFSRLHSHGSSAKVARERASAVLVRCRIEVPEDDRALERAIDNGKNLT